MIANQLSAPYSSLVQVWRERAAQYEENVDSLIFKRDAELLDRWLESREAMLKDDNLGDSIEAVEKLIRLHDDFEKIILAEEEKFSTLNRKTKAELKLAAKEARAREEAIARKDASWPSRAPSAVTISQSGALTIPINISSYQSTNGDSQMQTHHQQHANLTQHGIHTIHPMGPPPPPPTALRRGDSLAGSDGRPPSVATSNSTEDDFVDGQRVKRIGSKVKGDKGDKEGKRHSVMSLFKRSKK